MKTLVRISSICFAFFGFSIATRGDGLPATVTFDDLSTPAEYGSPIPANYDGLQWTDLDYLDASGFVPSGFQNGLVSGSNVAFNEAGNPASISGSGSFDFNSAHLTAAWNDGLQLEVQGFVGNVLVYDNLYALNAVSPAFITFDYLGVDQVTFISSGGVNHGYGGSGTQFVMDDLTVAVPEPGFISPAVVCAALAGFWFNQRTAARKSTAR